MAGTQLEGFESGGYRAHLLDAYRERKEASLTYNPKVKIRIIIKEM